MKLNDKRNMWFLTTSTNATVIYNLCSLSVKIVQRENRIEVNSQFRTNVKQ